MPQAGRRLLSLFWPLAASSLLMGTAEALVSAGLARAPGPEVALAAYGAVLAVALLIEAPVIPLLHAANALGYSRATRRLVFGFMLAVGAGCGALHALVALSPLYGIVFGHWLGLPAAVVAVARPGMIAMIPWSPAIAWRRYFQGVLIRQGVTRPIGIGTGVRTVTVAIVLIGGLMLRPDLGVAIGGLALALGVSAEAVFITFAARAAGEPVGSGPPLNLRHLIVFFLPLALTNGVSFLGRTVAAAQLARGMLAVPSLAAWPVAWAALFLIQGPVTMTQQLVIASPDGIGDRSLWRFTMGVGGVATAVVAVLLPLGLPFYFMRIIGIQGTVLALAMDAVILMTVLPMLVAQQQFWQGVLVRTRSTWAIIAGSSANLAMLTAAGFLGVGGLRWPAVDVVALATLAGYGAELGVLALASRRRAPVPVMEALPAEAGTGP